MIVRVLEPRCIGSRQSYESAQRFLVKADSRHTVQMVEIVKRPGQTLGKISFEKASPKPSLTFLDLFQVFTSEKATEVTVLMVFLYPG